MAEYRSQPSDHVVEATKVVLQAFDIAREADPQRETIIAMIQQQGGVVPIPDTLRSIGVVSEGCFYSDLAVAVLETMDHLMITSRSSHWIPFINMQERMLSVGPASWFEDYLQIEILEEHLRAHPELGN